MKHTLDASQLGRASTGTGGATVPTILWPRIAKLLPNVWFSTYAPANIMKYTLPDRDGRDNGSE